MVVSVCWRILSPCFSHKIIVLNAYVGYGPTAMLSQSGIELASQSPPNKILLFF